MTGLRSRGFTLLEVVVALAIMALALGVLYRTVGGSVRAVGDVSRAAQAVVLAESLLQLRDGIEPQGWNESGSWDTFRWSASTTPYDAGGDGRIALHRVQIDVSWPDGLRERTFRLVTLRAEQREGPR